MSLFRRLALSAIVFAIPVILASPFPAGIPTARAATAAPAADAAAARSVIDGFDASLLKAMKNAKTLGVKGRYDLLAPEVKNRFDLRAMVAIASGTAWFKASPAQQDKLADAFARFTIATYADQFDSFDGESFVTTGVTRGPRGTMIVNTRLVQPNDSPVTLSYVTRKDQTGWKIIDVLVDNGISQLAVRRSEYSSLLAQKGVPALVAELDSKTAKLLNG